MEVQSIRRSGWQIVGGPDGTAERIDGALWCWTLRREDGVTASVFVRIEGSALGTDPAELPDRLAAAIESHGRTEVEAVASGIDPPRLISFDGLSPVPRRAIGALAA